MSLRQLAKNGLKDWPTVAITTFIALATFSLSFSFPVFAVGALVVAGAMGALIIRIWKKRKRGGFL